MCNVLVASSIVEVLEQMVTDRKVFTTYDVTKEVRSNISDTVMHNDVRSIVMNEFQIGQMQGYNRELCTLNLSNSPVALVYFPSEKAAIDHPFVDEIDNIDNGSTGDGITDDIVLDNDEYKITKEGRIQIPQKLLSQINPQMHGSYDIYIGGNLKCATKDANGGIRVCLRQFGIKGNKVKILVDTLKDTINIDSV